MRAETSLTGTAVMVLALACVPGLAVRAQDQPSGPRPGWPCVGAPDPSHYRVAEATGGQIFLFHPSEVGESAGLMMASMTHDQTIFRVSGRLVEGVHEFEVPVDSSVESVFFSVSLQCLQVVTVAQPSGVEVQSNAPGVEYAQFEAGRVVTVREPAPGAWKVTVSGTGLFFLIVQAKTDVALSSFTFLPRRGETHEDPTAILTTRSGESRVVRAAVRGAAGQIGFRLVTSGGATLQTLALAEEGEGLAGNVRVFSGSITTPAEGFRLALSGVDEQGLRLQRFDPRLFTPSAR